MITEFFTNILGNVTQIIEQYNYLVIFVAMTIESSFIPFPSELVMIPAGYLASKAKISFGFSVLAGVLGSIVGALINYYLAKSLGYKILHKYGKYFFINSEKLTKIQGFFTKHGAVSTFSGRLLPVIRQYISIPAGISNMCLKRFTFFTACGSAIWMFTLTVVGFLFGHNQDLIKENLTFVTLAALVSVLMIITFYIFRQKRKAKAIIN